MAVDQPKVIDIITKDKNGHFSLVISDHLDWRETSRHLDILQEKINDYLAFLEKGEIYEKYPDARGHRIRIDVVFHHRPNAEANSFLARMKSIIADIGFELRWELFADTPYKI